MAALGYFDDKAVWHPAPGTTATGAKVITTRKPAASSKREPPVSVPFWDPYPDPYEQFRPVDGWSPWDTATLAGLTVPGLVRIRSRKHRKTIVQGGTGATSENMVDTGAQASQIEIVCTMWTPEHLRQYSVLTNEIDNQRANRGRKALQVSHPALALLRIRNLYLTTVGAPECHGPGGTWIAVIEGQEYKDALKGAQKGNPYPISAAEAAKDIPKAGKLATIKPPPSLSPVTTKP